MSSLPDFMNNNVKARVTAGASPTFICNRGFASVTRPAAGQHRLILNEKIPTTAMVVHVARELAAAGSIGYLIVDDGTIDVYTKDATPAAADVNFGISVERVGF